MSDLERLKDVELFAWMGEDEHGSGEIGIKQGLVPAGYIPLVSIHRGKLTAGYIHRGLAVQAATYGKTIRLVRFKMVDVVATIEPPPGAYDGPRSEA